MFAALLPLWLFLAAGWGRAAIEKVIDAEWWTGQALRGFLDVQREHMLPFFVPFADNVVEPLAPAIAWLVVWTQASIAICLISNRYTRPALWAGIALNVSFIMAGRVNPSAFYLVMQAALLFALSRPVGPRIAVHRAIAWSIPALLAVLFAQTLHPAEVIDDPALMLSFVCALASVTSLVMVKRAPGETLVEIFRTPFESLTLGLTRQDESS